MKKITNNFLIIASMAFSMTLTGCFEADEPSFSSDINVPTRVISQNSLFMPILTIDKAGWVVVHADNGNNAPVVPDIISNPVQLQSAGRYPEVFVDFTSDTELNDGDLVWAMLHYDTGQQGQYEFDGQGDEDPPVMMDGEIVMDSAKILAPQVEVSDQPVENNEITVDRARIGFQSWVVIHLADDQNAPGEIVGWTQLTQAEPTEITVSLDSDKTYNTGDVLFAMLHIDAPPVDQFDFPGGNDEPEVFGFDDNGEGIIVLDEFTVQ